MTTKEQDCVEFTKPVAKLIWAFSNPVKRDAFREKRRRYVKIFNKNYADAGIDRYLYYYADLFNDR